MSFRLPEEDSEEERQPYSYWNSRQPATPTPYQQVGRTSANPFSRPPLRPGTGTTESASFHSLEPEPEHKSIDIEPYNIEPETETQLPDPETEFDLEPELEPTTVMATEQPPAMEVDHKGKSYLKKPTLFNGNRRKVNDFIYACNLFFEGSSDKDFPTDKQKIIFILSYMSEGEAQRWRKNYIETTIRQADGSYTWPTKAVFLATFKAAFLNEDEKEESIRKLDYINQGTVRGTPKISAAPQSSAASPAPPSLRSALPSLRSTPPSRSAPPSCCSALPCAPKSSAAPQSSAASPALPSLRSDPPSLRSAPPSRCSALPCAPNRTALSRASNCTGVYTPPHRRSAGP